MKKIERIIFSTGYGNIVKIEAKVDGEWCIIEKDFVKDFLIEEFNRRGFDMSMTGRQKRQRLTINK